MPLSTHYDVLQAFFRFLPLTESDIAIDLQDPHLCRDAFSTKIKNAKEFIVI
jgi:hypothetical protein